MEIQQEKNALLRTKSQETNHENTMNPTDINRDTLKAMDAELRAADPNPPQSETPFPVPSTPLPWWHKHPCGGTCIYADGETNKPFAMFTNEADCDYAIACANLWKQMEARATEAEAARDDADQAISRLYFLIFGASPEWSNAFGREDAISSARDALAGLREHLKRAEAERDALKSTQAKILRMVAISEKANDEQSEIEVACSASFDEALAHTMLEKSEGEIADLRAKLADAVRERDEARADKERLDWLEAQIHPGCFYTINHYQYASQFYGSAVGWTPETPIGLGDFPTQFAATLRSAIDSARKEGK